MKAEVGQGDGIEVLEALVIDVGSDHNSRDTARRVAKLYVDEVFAGALRGLAEP